MANPLPESPRGQLFLGLVRDGRSLRWSARTTGIHMEAGYRLLRERYCQLRTDGLDPDAALAELGCRSARAVGWETLHQRRLAVAPRHHLKVELAAESTFWSVFEDGSGVGDAAAAAGISRATGYRMLQRRFVTLREAGGSLAAVATALRVSVELAAGWDAARLRRRVRARRLNDADLRRAVRTSALQGERVPRRGPPPRPGAVTRDERYWELMRQGLTYTEACRVLGVSRRLGTRIRRDRRHQTAPPSRVSTPTGRYLSLRERLRIADLTLMGMSQRAVAAELGRSPSTVKRELDRHRDNDGRYLPHRAQDRAVTQRRRPRPSKLTADDRLRRNVQRKLNRYWSPQQISGWLRSLPADGRGTVCTETIYRALLVPGIGGLHERYCAKLRTGRKIRRSRWLSGNGATATVKNKTMIDQRPPEVDERVQVGHWEGDLILGEGCGSAMVTLRERVTQFGIIVNLPVDHTALSVNAAVTAAFASLPAHVTRTLTWDQGVEMSRHRELSAAIDMPIFFAERASPWQRGANENFNGLARQYYPKGTDLSVHTAGHVAATVRSLNTRPRKGLGYKTPARCLAAAIRAVPKQLPLLSETPAI